MNHVIKLLLVFTIFANSSFSQEESAKYYRFVDDDTNEAINNEKTYWFNSDNFKRVVESSGRLYYHGYNIAAHGLDKTGSAANEDPWLVTSGIDGIEDKVSIKRFAYIPGKVKVDFRHAKNVTSRNIDKNWFHGSYPEGSRIGQILNLKGGEDDGETFAIRILMKDQGFWHGVEHVNDSVSPPKGYVSPKNCVDCHQDVGKISFEVDVSRDWYGNIGVASEKGGPISFHPFKWTTKDGSTRLMAAKPEVNPELKHLFDFTKVSGRVTGVEGEIKPPTDVTEKKKPESYSTKKVVNSGDTPVKSIDKPEFLYFGGEPWCGPCRIVGGLLKQDLCKKELVNWDFKKYNDPGNPNVVFSDLAKFQEFNVTTVPTIVIIKNGKEVDRINGLTTLNYLLNKLKNTK